MSRLTAVVITMFPQKTGATPGFMGRAVQDFFLGYLSEANLELAKQIHDQDGRKPYTCSELNGGKVLDKNSRQYSPEESVWFRLTGLNEPVSARLWQMVLNPPTTLKFGEVTFNNVSVTADPQTHEWADNASYELLLATYLNPRRKARYQATLSFASPTTFRERSSQKQGKKARSWPIPMPEWVFGSLREHWNTYSPFPIEENFLDYVADHVAIKKYRLVTHAVPLKNGNVQMGFVGNVTYKLLSHEPEQAKRLEMLAAFSFFAGIGYQTTTGLGQARSAPDE